MNDYKIQIASMIEGSEDMSPLEIAINLEPIRKFIKLEKRDATC
jgi:hypothetical protein